MVAQALTRATWVSQTHLIFLISSIDHPYLSRMIFGRGPNFIVSNPQKNPCGFLNGSSRYFGRSDIRESTGLLTGIFGHPKKSKHPRITHVLKTKNKQSVALPTPAA